MTEKEQRFSQAERRGYVLREHWRDSHLLNAMMQTLERGDPLIVQMHDLTRDYDANFTFSESCEWLARLNLLRRAARRRVC